MNTTGGGILDYSLDHWSVFESSPMHAENTSRVSMAALSNPLDINHEEARLRHADGHGVAQHRLDHFDVVDIRCLPRRRGRRFSRSTLTASRRAAGSRVWPCHSILHVADTLPFTVPKWTAAATRRLPRASGKLGLADLKDGQLPNFSRPCFPGDGIFDAEAD